MLEMDWAASEVPWPTEETLTEIDKSAPGLPTDPAAAGPPGTVLLVEDDRNIQRSLSFQLERQGYVVTCVGDGEEGLREALKGSYQVVVLDIMLPKLDGLSVCRRIRAMYPEQPIIITSARGSDLDKITGLDFGADDYLGKPFSAAELEARIRAVRRRLAPAEPNRPPALVVAGAELDPVRRCLRFQDRTCRLTPKEFEILSLMMRYPGRIFARDALLAHVWGFSYEGDSRAVDAHLKRLRGKLQELMPDVPELIEAVYGLGYRLREPDRDPE